MKLLILGIVFIGMPFWLLQKFVMPELDGLKEFYSNIDQIAQQAASPNTSTTKLQ